MLTMILALAACPADTADTATTDTNADADTDTDTDTDTGDCIASTETCNGADDACDGEVDEAGSTAENNYYADADHDGYGDTADSVAACAAPGGYVADHTDCDDAQGEVHPGQSEVANDGHDNDCDPLTVAGVNVYDAFSPTANPFGDWSLGYSTGADGAGFTAFSGYAEFDASVDFWAVGGSGEPRVYRNHTAVDWTYASVTFAASSIILHPGPAGEYAVLRWTAPASTRCEVDVSFDGRDSTSTAVAAYVAGALLTAGDVSGFGSTLPVRGSFSVDAGDTVDFTVGPNGNYNFDSTGLEGTLACL